MARIDGGEPVLGRDVTQGVGVVCEPGCVIGNDVSIGHHVVIGSGASLGDGCVIGNHVSIGPGTKLGAGVNIADFAFVGKWPKLSPRSTAAVAELPPLVLGDGCSIGSHTVLMAGSTFGRGVLVGDNAGVREGCTIGDEVLVGRSVTVENGTRIGARTKIQSGAYVTAYVTLEEDVFIAPMVVTTNDNYMGRTERRHAERKGCTVRRGARVGGGSHLLPGVEIGEEAFVATGSVVTRDVPARTLVMGVPARAVREVPEDELLENQ